MEEENNKLVRTKAEIEEEYSRCALSVGDNMFKAKFLSAQIELAVTRMAQLNQESVDNNKKKDDGDPGPAAA